MTTYRKIHGRSIQAVTTDPTESVAEGQIWYNTTSDTFKSVVAFESFTSSSPLNTARYFMAGAGSQTAALSFGGDASPPYTNASEEYNGSGWTNTSSMNTARTSLAGAGTSTAGLGFGGYFAPPASNKNETEEYNGSSWSEQNNLGTARYRLAGAGTQTAGLAFGGNDGPTSSTVSADTEEYNGTSWSEQNNLSQGRRQLGGLGTQTAALAFGGRKQPGNVDVTDTEEYDGTSWSSGGALPQISRGYSGTAGTQTAGLSIGGVIAPGIYNGALKYDGSTWSISPATMATGTNEGSGLMSGSTQSAGMAAGGYGPSSVLGNTEEFNISINTITAGAWASGGSLNTARASLAGSGSSKDSALAFGGVTNRNQPSQANSNASETYDGTSWTEGNNLGTARQNLKGLGTVPASLAIGGYVSGAVGNVEEYGGTSWSEQNDLSTARWNVAQAGIQTAAVATTGSTPSLSNSTEEYDGTSWTAGTNFPETRTGADGTGTSTAMAVLGGTNSSPSGPGTDDQIAEYDGSSWTIASGTLLNKRTGIQSNGPASLCLNSLGYDTTAYVSTSELYNGTTCVTQPNLATARSSAGGGNGSMPSTSAIVFGGSNNPTPGPADSSVEEFTGETTALNVNTLTQS